jgi:hypothetical protein
MRVGDVENDEARPEVQAPAVHPIWQLPRSRGLHSLPVSTRLSGSRIFWGFAGETCSFQSYTCMIIFIYKKNT